MKKILFLTFDGLLEPLGYSQIISYLKNLSSNYNITVFSVEKKEDLKNFEHLQKIKEVLFNNNIQWKFFRYNKSSLYKYFILVHLFANILYIVIKKKIDIIHSRSYVMGLISYFLSFLIKFSHIFDIRGFWIEERIEWEIWKKNSLKYIFFKFIEPKIFFNSQAIVTLTNDAKKELINKKYKNIYVIPTSVKLNFLNKNKLISRRIKFTHLGAIGTRYNFEFCLEIIKNIKKEKNIFLSIINKGEHKTIDNLLKKYNFKNTDFEIKYIKPYEVNSYIYSSDFGIFFPKKGFYLKAYFPTKLGEFLSCGIPVITSKINDHVDNIIRENKIGVIIDDLDKIDLKKFNSEFSSMVNDKKVNERCISVANRYFDINKASLIYSKIYQNI